MVRVIIALAVLATLAGCTQRGSMWGTKQISIWDRNASPPAVYERTIDD